MKLYHFVLVFAAFAVVTVIMTDMGFSEKRYLEKERAGIDKQLYSAVESAAKELRSSVSGFNEVVEQKAIEAFFYSLYASLGIIDVPEARKNLNKYVPAFIISLKDGYYIYRNAEGTDMEGNMKGPYGTGYVKSGLISYDDGKNEAEISFAAYLRSYPVRGETYDGYCFSSASIVERVRYIIDENMVYHISGCSYAGDTGYVFFSGEGCVLMGAVPCRYCIEGE